jgi:hypothetical protein
MLLINILFKLELKVYLERYPYSGVISESL